MCVIIIADKTTISKQYSDAVMSAMASQITTVSSVYPTVCSGANKRKHHSSASLFFCGGNSPGTVEFPTQRASNKEKVSIWWRHHVRAGAFVWPFAWAHLAPLGGLSVFNTSANPQAVWLELNTLRPRQNGHHCADDSFDCILLNEKVLILNQISLKYVLYGLIDNMATLV